MFLLYLVVSGVSVTPALWFAVLAALAGGAALAAQGALTIVVLREAASSHRAASTRG